MRNLPSVDHVILPEPTNPVSYWLMKDLSMKQTILLWLTTSMFLIGSAFNEPHKLSSASIGFMSWVVIEYMYHRFIGHQPVTSELTKHANFYLHGKHHFAPKDIDHIFISPAIIFFAAIATYKIIFSNVTDNPKMALAFAIFHYSLYEIMHCAMHKYSIKLVGDIPVIGNLLVRLWGNHERHHKDPDTHFLVTTGGLLKA